VGAARIRRVLECLELVGLAARSDDYPARLSGGQKQRVAIARALASQPEVLLCDAPTSALDAETTRSLLDTVRAANADLGVTIVIVSHELPALGALCNRVAVLEHGAVAETFAPVLRHRSRCPVPSRRAPSLMPSSTCCPTWPSSWARRSSCWALEWPRPSCSAARSADRHPRRALARQAPMRPPGARHAGDLRIS